MGTDRPSLDKYYGDSKTVMKAAFTNEFGSTPQTQNFKLPRLKQIEKLTN